MNHKKSVVSLLLALVLAWGLVPAAQAAEARPALRGTVSQATGKISLSLDGLDGSGVYGAQLELTLEGEYPDCSFVPASSTAYSPDCLVRTAQGKTELTIYVTGQDPLNSSTTMALGDLALGKQLGGTNVMPATAEMILLGRGLAALPGGMTGQVPVSATVWQPPGGFPIIGGTGKPNTNKPDTSKPETTPPAETMPPAETVPTTPGDVTLPFQDVQASDWFYAAVQYVYANGMMGGTSETAFSPTKTTTRGMIVTILHRLEGSPAAEGTAFSDVAPQQYYAAPVAWASANGIVTGYGDGSFRPQADITRVQMAAILFRYAQSKGADVTQRAGLEAFPDAASVSSYAVDAMSWAVSAGLISGMDGQLVPGGSATRAQAATILMRFCTNVLGKA